MRGPLIDLETAKEAKKKGFDWPVNDYFIVIGDKVTEDNGDGDCEFVWLNHNKYKNYYSRPTVELYQQWVKSLETGTPLCFNKKEEVKEEIKKLTYLILDKRTGYYKIGRSKDPLHREKTLQAEQPDIELVCTCITDMEKELHRKYSYARLRGEWFDLSINDVKDIKDLFSSTI